MKSSTNQDPKLLSGTIMFTLPKGTEHMRLMQDTEDDEIASRAVWIYFVRSAYNDIRHHGNDDMHLTADDIADIWCVKTKSFRGKTRQLLAR